MRMGLGRVPQATQQPRALLSCISARFGGCYMRSAASGINLHIASTAPSRAAVGRVCEGVGVHRVSHEHDSAQRADLCTHHTTWPHAPAPCQ